MEKIGYYYGELEDKLIDLFGSGLPDFVAAEELIRQGVNLNAIGKFDGDNILSEIIMGYGFSEETCKKKEEHLIQIIHFFLDHGFNFATLNDQYGAQCLSTVGFTYCGSGMVRLTQQLLYLGAKNVPYDEFESKLIETYATKADFMFCETEIELSNIYEAIYQIYHAIEEKRPYEGIASYEAAIGRKIVKVLVKNDELDEDELLSKRLEATGEERLYYRDTLYLVLDDGAYLITSRCADFWVDTYLPDMKLIDVSDMFSLYLGKEIKAFHFDAKEFLKASQIRIRPITMITLNTGEMIKVSTNVGETDSRERVAYFQLIGS